MDKILCLNLCCHKVHFLTYQVSISATVPVCVGSSMGNRYLHWNTKYLVPIACRVELSQYNVLEKCY